MPKIIFGCVCNSRFIFDDNCDAEQKYQINNQLFSWSGSISATGLYYLPPGAASTQLASIFAICKRSNFRTTAMENMVGCFADVFKLGIGSKEVATRY